MKPGGSPRVRMGGVILAGGASRRMDGNHKAFCALDGRLLLDHVIERLRPQVRSLVLSVAREEPAWNRFGLRQVPDGVSTSPDGDTPGPLAGLLAAMECLHGDHDWVLVAPCDAPFVPRDLGDKLVNRAREREARACLAAYQGVLQSTFSVWHCSLLPALRTAVRMEGFGGFRQFLGSVGYAEQQWEIDAVPPFFNVNTLEDLATAQSLFEQSAQTSRP